MAISDTITSMYENVGNVYDVLELAGADLTNVDKNIENLKQSWEERLLYFLANGTDVVWNNWLPKINGTGETITLNNTIEAKMDFVYKGNTSQTGTPTPDTPIPVQVVSGDNTILVRGKNLCPNAWSSGSISGSTGQIVSYGSRIYSPNPIALNGNTTYSFKHNNTSTWHIRASIDEYDKDNNHLGRIGGLNGSVDGSFTTQANTKYINITIIENTDTITYAEYQTLLSSGKLQPMLNAGSIAQTYVDYVGATYPLSLGNIELCKIGDYQDRIYKDNGKWYLNKQIGKVVFNGSQNISLASGTPRRFNATYSTLGITNAKDGTTATDTQANYRMCDHFNYTSGQTTWGNYYLHNNWLVMLDSGSVIASASDLSTWLSNNNTTIYYVLATPTTTEITDTTLISQLEAIKKSYNTQTNISQTNADKPFILDVVALGELEI